MHRSVNPELAPVLQRSFRGLLEPDCGVLGALMVRRLMRPKR
jgi:hypothetical protein